ncbi:MAG: ATP-dependent zinc metalloprotease FtsH [Chloroflexota bacterium]
MSLEHGNQSPGQPPPVAPPHPVSGSGDGAKPAGVSTANQRPLGQPEPGPRRRSIFEIFRRRSEPATTNPTDGNKRAPSHSARRSWLLFLGLLLFNYFVIARIVPDQADRPEIPYTLFRSQVETRNVVEVTTRGDTIQGTFREPVVYPAEGLPDSRSTKDFTTHIPIFADPGLERLLIDSGVVINARPLEEPRSWWMNLLLSFGPTILLIGAFLWLSRRASAGLGGAMGLGQSRAKRYDQSTDNQKVTFQDVAGIEEAERELVEIVDFLKDPQKYTRLGGTAPKGVLLVGPPGTGKTLLARAVAGEAEVPFFSMGASEFVEMVVGVGASRVRDLFRQAREAAPAIIFVDELDAIGRARGGGFMSGAHSEQEQTLNQILTEMDGFSSREGVIILAATNRPDVLDPALLRPGRFDRRVVVHPPDRKGREAILRVHTRTIPLSKDVDLESLAKATPGLVGADLRNLVNEAALGAARRDAEYVFQRDFMDALEKAILGPARDLVLTPADREKVAYHEGGHTILGLVVKGADPVNRVTITPRGQALGVTYQRPEDDRHNYDEVYLRARIVGALGGRAAEELVYGTRTTGSESDMEMATSLARSMVTRWGMSERLGPVTLAPRDQGFLGQSDIWGSPGPRPFSEATSRMVDTEVRVILDDCYQIALEELRARRPTLDALVAALLERETLDEPAILMVTGLSRQEAETPRRLVDAVRTEGVAGASSVSALEPGV